MHSSYDGIASKNSGASSGINRIASDKGSGVEIISADEGLDPIVEVKAMAS